MRQRTTRRPSAARRTTVAALATLALAAAASAQLPAGTGAAGPRRGHSDYLASLTARAMREGFARESVPLLAPVAGPGREVVARRLLARVGGSQASFSPRLQLGALKPGPPDRRVLSYLGDAGYVEVFADGTKLRVRGNLDDPKEIERAGGAQLEKSELESLGMRFVREALADFVKVGERESVTFLGVRYLVNGGAEPEGKETVQSVASIAVFGREINGIPVVGSGSKVAVWFDNSRQPVAFDVDWPVYRLTGQTQRVLARDALTERVTRTTVPLQGAEAVSVRRFECGYVDLGATRRGPSIQSGCSIAWERRGRDGVVSAHLEFVPAGTQVLKESRWPLASAIAAGKTINTSSPDFLRYLGGPKAPGQAPADPATK